MPNSDAAKHWIIKNQLGRRNLTIMQRAELALQRENTPGKFTGSVAGRNEQIKSSLRNMPDISIIRMAPISRTERHERQPKQSESRTKIF